MCRLVCTIDYLPYGGKVYREGDHFSAVSDEDARLLKGFGKAKDDVSGYHTASMDAEPVATQVDVPQPDVPLPRRRGRPPKYLRADMRAED